MEILVNYIASMSVTALLVVIIGGYFLIVGIFDYRQSKVRKIPVFSGEPPYRYKVIGDSEFMVEGSSYQSAMNFLSQKAFKMGADAVKDFKIHTFKKRMNDEHESFMLSGLLVKKTYFRNIYE